LPENPHVLPAAHARLLDASAALALRVDDDGKLHVERIEAIPGRPP